MNDLQKRTLLFLGLCIPSRFLIAFLLSKLSKNRLFYFGLLLLIPVVGWTYIYLTSSRKTGGETFGAPIWWDHIRPIHAGFYFMAALLALRGSNNAYLPIVIDTSLGLLAFLHQRKLLF